MTACPRVLITGARGMLAPEIVSALSPTHAVRALTRDEMELTDAAQVRAVIARERPAVVINTAAMTNVDGCERDPDAAHRANADGPRNLAEACADHGVTLIHISTDYVFDGTKGAPYIESDPVNPVNHYGESKLRGEQAVAAACADHKILRVSMLYGVHRTNFVDFVATQIETGGTVKAVTDNTGSPTHCPDIAAQIAALVERPETGVFHCAGLGGCTRLEMAEHIRTLLDRENFPIQAVTQADFPQMLATRPVDSRLDCSRLRELGILKINPWCAAVANYLTERGLNT